MRRRHGLLLVAATPLVLLACSAPPVQRFATLAEAAKSIEGLMSGWRANGKWTLSQMLNHAAQSIEYSMTAFPESKPAWFQATAGSAAFALFNARGRMSHPLTDPLPGAPAISPTDPLAAAIERALEALRDFEAHTGALAPHFAFGRLDKAQYTRAHLMHLANHWDEVVRADARPGS